MRRGTELLNHAALAVLATIGALPAAAQVGVPDPTASAADRTETQSVPADQASTAPEGREVVVTGSLIRGTPETAALPVDVISAEELAKRGNPSPVELMKALVVSSGVLGDSNQFDNRAQGSEGIATVNLRGLGPERTLVLLNSKRVASVGVGVGGVDLNSLPQAAIGRIEVLKDGAAATYGSDAIAGVVNFITRTNQEGFLAVGDYKYVRGSNGDYTGSLSYGHSADGLRVLLAGGFQHRSELLAIDRDFAVQPFAQNPEGGWSSGGNPSAFLPVTATGAALGGVRVDAGCAAVGGTVAASGSLTAPALNTRCFGNNPQFDALTDTENRFQLYGEMEIDLVSDVRLNVSALFAHTDIPHYRTSPSYLLTQAPSASVLPGGFAATAPAGFFVPASNPGLQAYRAQNPGALPAAAGGATFPLLLFRPFLNGGNPAFLDESPTGGAFGTRQSNTSRVTADVSGRLTNALDFALGVTYQDYDRTLEEVVAIGDRVQLALRGFGGPNCSSTAGTPGQNGCLYLNPFSNAIERNPVTGQTNPNYVAGVANTPELASWLASPTGTTYRTSLFVAEGSLSGRTGVRLPGGDLAFAAGGQYRRTGFDLLPFGAGDLRQNPCRDTPVNGNRACAPVTGALSFLGSNLPQSFDGDVYAGFAELQLPILDRLNVQLAARYEDYGGDVGSTFNPKATARLELLDWLAVRGSYGTTFRGPPDQFLGTGAATVLQQVGTAFRPVDVRGNPALQPESAKNLSGGLILKSGGFSFTIDYYRYELDGLIVGEPVAGMVSALFGTTGSANCANPAFTALRSRFNFNDGGGVPGAGTCNVANVSRIRTSYVNGADAVNSGVDAQLDVRLRDVLGGSFAFGGTATYLINYRIDDQIVEGIVVQPSFDAVGKLNTQTTAYPTPEWKAQGYLEYSHGRIDTRLTVNHIASYVDQRLAPFAPRVELIGLVPNATQSAGQRVAPFTTADFVVRAQLTTGTTVNLGILNLTDEDPSFARLNYNYDPFTGNVLGRQVKIGFSQAF